VLRVGAHRRAAVAAGKSADFRIFSLSFPRKSSSRAPRASVCAHGRAAPPWRIGRPRAPRARTALAALW